MSILSCLEDILIDIPFAAQSTAELFSLMVCMQKITFTKISQSLDHLGRYHDGIVAKTIKATSIKLVCDFYIFLLILFYLWKDVYIGKKKKKDFYIFGVFS